MAILFRVQILKRHDFRQQAFKVKEMLQKKMTEQKKKKQGYTHTHTPTHMHIDLYTVIIPMCPQQSKESLSFLCPICSSLKSCTMSAQPCLLWLAQSQVYIRAKPTGSKQRQPPVISCEVIWVSLIPPDSCHSPSRCHRGIYMHPLLHQNTATQAIFPPANYLSRLDCKLPLGTNENANTFFSPCILFAFAGRSSQTAP